MAPQLVDSSNPLLGFNTNNFQKTLLNQPFQGTIPKSFRTFTSHGAADYLNIRYQTLVNWRHRNIGPHFIVLPIKQGRGYQIRYLLEDLQTFHAARKALAKRMPQPGRGRLAGGKNQPKNHSSTNKK